MYCYKTRYGEDRDGNRGVDIIEYELDEYDTPEIVEQLFDKLVDDCLTETETIMLYCPLTDDHIEVEINTSDYINELEEVVKESKAELEKLKIYDDMVEALEKFSL